MLTGPLPSKGTSRRPAVADAPDPAETASALSKAKARDEIMLTALARGDSYAEAGKAAKSSERTVRRRMSDPEFVAELGRRRGAFVSAVTGALVSNASIAVEVILECLEEGDRTSDRLKAAQLLLGMARQFHSDCDIDARLVALEAAAEGKSRDDLEEDDDNGSESDGGQQAADSTVAAGDD